MNENFFFNEGNQIHNFISSSSSGTVINYGSGSDFLMSYSSGSGSTSQKVTVPTVPVPQHWDPDQHKDFELDPDLHQNNADPQPWSQLSKDCCIIYNYV